MISSWLERLLEAPAARNDDIDAALAQYDAVAAVLTKPATDTSDAR